MTMTMPMVCPGELICEALAGASVGAVKAATSWKLPGMLFWWHHAKDAIVKLVRGAIWKATRDNLKGNYRRRLRRRHRRPLPLPQVLFCAQGRMLTKDLRDFRAPEQLVHKLCVLSSP